MNISKADIFRGCLISSIMHTIKVNEYPELSYEQSWDGDNFSMQNSAGLRGTISFCPDFCIGAIRNDDDVNLDVKCDIQLKLEGFPSYVAQKAKKETLQYLLIDNNGIVVHMQPLYFGQMITFILKKDLLIRTKRIYCFLKI